MKLFILIFLVFTSTTSFVPQTNNHHEQNSGIFREFRVGNQIWMAQNLQVSHFKNGDRIEEVQTYEEWQKAIQEKRPAWCYYGNYPKKGVYDKEYGKLYNWYAVTDSRGIAPEGWHIAKEEEWALYYQHMSEGNINVKRNRIRKSFYGVGGTFNNINQSRWASPELPSIEGVFISPCDIEDWLFESELVVLQDFYWYLSYNKNTGLMNIPYQKMGLAIRCLKD